MINLLSKTKTVKSEKVKFFKNKNTLQLYAMCSIPMLLLFIFNYVPVFGLIIAFKDYRYDKGILGSAWTGFKNFEFFFKSNDFVRITSNTLILNAFFIIIGLIASVSLALLLFEIKRKRYVKIYQTVLILPNYLSWVVVGYMAYAFLNPQYGFINSILRAIGLDAIQWYSKPGYWPYILAMASVWKWIGINSVIYYASLMGINDEYFEAAIVDGAKKIDILRYITIPFLIPLMTILTVLAIGNIFRADFGLFYQLTRDVGTLYPTTDVIDTYIYRALRNISDMGMTTAIGLVQSMVGFVLILFTNYIVKKIEPDNTLF